MGIDCESPYRYLRNEFAWVCCVCCGGEFCCSCCGDEAANCCPLCCWQSCGGELCCRC
ncbi:hypothetical protein PUN28_015381 [Cardiocondyla obscurior]|uniref:Uncharacterized protein n=1 Tax=Cardiocondyla obscurior TaxID=286306 RepID=A0AAW2EX23_9HYME